MSYLQPHGDFLSSIPKFKSITFDFDMEKLYYSVIFKKININIPQLKE